MKVILDTNVIVSAFLNPKGIPAEILSLVLSEKIILCYDNKILSEYTDVLTRSKFNFNRELVNDFLEFVKIYGEYIVAEPQDIQFIDESDRRSDDKIFYDVFRGSDTNYIITGNKKHYPKEENILLPREFKEI
ncbi:PIN domain-containing protein [Spirochaetia bacterium]|nr:PIN domain-containing protein [Spirochaetia bacterium]GHU92701.1 PIN domain-containing protein [Spirochaetia bacterium]